MLEDYQHHSSESDENSENLETANGTDYFDNETNNIGENTETESDGVRNSLTESNEGDVEVNSNIVS